MLRCEHCIQEHPHAINVDQHLVVSGSGGAMFALGDAANVEQPHVLDHAEELFKQADGDADGMLTCSEVRLLGAIALLMSCAGVNTSLLSLFWASIMAWQAVAQGHVCVQVRSLIRAARFKYPQLAGELC